MFFVYCTIFQVVKAYKYKLRDLSATQTQSLNSWVGACRYVYNLALETKQYAPIFIQKPSKQNPLASIHSQGGFSFVIGGAGGV